MLFKKLNTMLLCNLLDVHTPDMTFEHTKREGNLLFSVCERCGEPIKLEALDDEWRSVNDTKKRKY